MLLALKGFSNTVVYCDDLFVNTYTHVEQLRTNDVMLNRLVRYGLRVRPGGQKFIITQLLFLRYHISLNGIKTKRKKYNIWKLWYTIRKLKISGIFSDFFNFKSDIIVKGKRKKNVYQYCMFSNLNRFIYEVPYMAIRAIGHFYWCIDL